MSPTRPLPPSAHEKAEERNWRGAAAGAAHVPQLPPAFMSSMLAGSTSTMLDLKEVRWVGAMEIPLLRREPSVNVKQREGDNTLLV